MKNPLLVFLILLLFWNKLLSQSPDATLYFSNEKANLTNESKLKLKTLLETIKKNNSPSVTISGFTDTNGDTKFNLALSKKRAMAVSDYFTTNGIEKTKITIQFFGEDKPLTNTAQSLKENRRVEIVVGTLKKNDDKLSAGIFGKLFKQPIKHIFTETKVASNEELEMVGSEGTTIWIPANSLIRPNGEPARGDILIELTEYYKKSDMLLANLHTASDSAMLESGGMINVVARCRGERLALKAGSEMRIQFAISKTEKDMGVFNGKRVDNQINWKPRRRIEIGMIASSPGLINADAQTTKNLSKTQNLILSSDRLGWINCDRFSFIENITDLTVEIDSSYNAFVRLVFKDINSIMPGYKASASISEVNNIPVGRKATIVAFGMVKKTLYFISKEIVISENQVEKLALKETTFEALELKLKRVN